jgi:hypothetical protein
MSGCRKGETEVSHYILAIRTLTLTNSIPSLLSLTVNELERSVDCSIASMGSRFNL